MAIFLKELRRGVKGFLIWTGILSVMLLICVLVYPQMQSQMQSVNDLYANMGSFTSAFGLDKLNVGTMIGFYGVECGNLLGLGGGLFAAYLGITILSKEERDHTSEFLLSHPISRLAVFFQKLLAVIVFLILMNLVVFSCGALSIAGIGESVQFKEMILIHSAYLIMHLEIGCICFGISAFLRRGSIGIGLGSAALLYFLNIIRNISENADFLKYITPFAYADPSDIISNGALRTAWILLGGIYAASFLTLGIIKYLKKDLAA